MHIIWHIRLRGINNSNQIISNHSVHLIFLCFLISGQDALVFACFFKIARPPIYIYALVLVCLPFKSAPTPFLEIVFGFVSVARS